jgi:glutathione synthase/RimK-type ligase-like ATP-grasp enzyme
MILIAGIADESPTSLVVDALEAIGAHYRLFDQRRVASAEIALEVGDASGGGAIGGTLTLDDETIPLEAISGMFVRLMDDQLLPGIAEAAPRDARRIHCRRFHELLLRFADIAPGRVLNRPDAMASNQSKPFQAQVIRTAGFDIPHTLITNSPSAAREFIEQAWADRIGVIYKSVSGVRSIVQRVALEDVKRLDRIRWCPTQFQHYVTGTDIRVHVVGETVVAVTIVSDATDYRYAARETGREPTIAATELDADVRARCIGLARRLNLPLAGIDLRRSCEGRYVCFEVNPSPAFSFYEQRAGVPVASCIARYLAGEAD